MSRYTGPTFRKSRRYGFSILETNKEFSKGKKRITPPGMHGEKRVKVTNYGAHLYEKQKVKYMYGMGEKQFKNLFKKAGKLKGDMGLNFLRLLESRLDNVVFRMGIAPTRQAARQFVNHGHILVNGKKVDIPSYSVKVGSEIEIKPKLRKNEVVLMSIGNKVHTKEFVTFDKSNWKGTYQRLPERKELNSNINESYIVEFYNK